MDIREVDFLALIDDAKEDEWQPHALAMADWLEERGDRRAEGWRWLVENKKSPRAPIETRLQHARADYEKGWNWFCIADHFSPEHCTLERDLCVWLVNSDVGAFGTWGCYHSRSEALADAAKAIVNLAIQREAEK